ncbi:MAG TPA: ribonuclease Y [Clostridiales bacterium]|nr:ribonuclease Y [Clostridiales bacterium]
MPFEVTLLLGIVIGLVVGAGAFAIVSRVRRNVRVKNGKEKITDAEQEAKQILDNAAKDAENKKRDMVLGAKEEILQLRNDTERELKDRRAEVTKMERRLTQKEETLDRKTEALEKKNDQLDAKLKENDELREKIQGVMDQHLKRLEEISGYTAEEAKTELLSRMESETRHEMAQKLDELETEFKEEAETKARNILTLAIQRCAADHVAESTISVVSLPNDDMKGRIIGREGRNIQKLETLTGVELIIDDTPEAITISGFDPVRREIARLTLEKLISDGRIHPAKIEEMVEKSRKEVDAVIKQAGERATFETGVHGLHPELVKLLGRLRYRTSYGQNVLKHSIEVSWIAGMMAEELGLNGTVARRAGLLHDIGKAFPQDMEGSHVELGVQAARKYKESPEVIHAIEAHHGDVEPQTPIAVLIQAADAVSAARPGARREDMENYIKRLEKLESIAAGFEGVDKAYAIQAGREIRVMVKPEVVGDEKMKLIARDMAKKIEDECKYPGQIKINLIRETRAVDYAK